MGASCSNVEAAGKGAASHRSKREAVIPTEPISLKGDKAFKERYSTSKHANPKLLTVRHRDTQGEYVCRRIRKALAPCQDAAAIAEHLKRLNGLEHPHLCKFVEAFEDVETWYLIYEKADSTTLFQHVRAGDSFEEEDAAEYIRQITMALAVAHETGVVHGRLSPTKVVILPEVSNPLDDAEDDEDDDLPAQVKICDMGQGLVLRESCMQAMRRHMQGNGEEPRKELLECIPPEMAWEEVKTVDPTEGASVQVSKLDIWALGCIVYYMLTGSPPHPAVPGLSSDGLLERVKTRAVEYGAAEWGELSPEARDAVESMLKVNALLRPTASALLRHPWLRMPRSRLQKGRLLTLLRNIETNAAEGHFKRMVMRVIAQQLPPESRQVNKIERAFRFFDRNGDGVLNTKEICKCVRRMDLGDAVPENLEEVISLLDRDGSSTVNLQEFLAGALNPKYGHSHEKLWYAFNAFDRDGNGSVSIDEIEQIVRQVEAGLLGQEQVDGLVRCIREELKSSSQGHIDFDHFVYIMKTPTGSHDGGRAVQREMFRQAYGLFGVDCYDVRKCQPPPWNWQQMSQSAPSAYRRTNLVAVRRKTFQTAGAASVQSFNKDGGKSTAGSEANLDLDDDTGRGGSSKPRGRMGKQPGQQAGRR